MKDQRIGFQITGYADERGTTGQTVIAGPELGRDKIMAAWAAIKPGHKFPKGVKLAVLEERIEADRAIFISETIADEQQAAIELRDAKLKEAAQRKADEAKKKKQIADAARAVSDKAVARDQANFELISAQADRDNAFANVNTPASAEFSAASKKMFQARLETAEARLKKATDAFAAADKAWTDAKEARAKLAGNNLTA